MKPQLRTTVYIERRYHDPTHYIVTVCPGNEYCKVEISTSFHLMRASNLQYKMKKGTVQRHEYNDMTDFLETLTYSKLTTEIVMRILQKVLLLLKLD
jgi:hypothetical protein